MNFEEVYNTFVNLKEIVSSKKQAIIQKNTQELGALDEMSIALVDKIKKFDILNNDFSEDEKEKLKKVAQEIKTIQENNEILIKHSINVINNILSGILNIAQNDACSYDSRGARSQSSESLDISSITEEA